MKKASKRKATTKKKAAKKPTGKSAAKKATTAANDGNLAEQCQQFLEAPLKYEQFHEFLARLSDTERKTLKPQCIKWWKKTKQTVWVTKNETTHYVNPLLRPAALAVFWTGTFTDIKTVSNLAEPARKSIVEVLKTRQPEWIDQYIERCLKSKQYWADWTLCRELTKLGFADKPTLERYYTSIISGLTYRPGEDGPSVLSALEDDPALLEDEVWKLFEYEGDDTNTLAYFDEHAAFDSSDKTWYYALVTLAERGQLSRERLLDASISALGLGFNHFRAKWFFEFFDQLEPTSEEIESRVDALLPLLGSHTPNVAKWAFEKVVELLKAQANLNLQDVVVALGTLLHAKAKGTVIKALKTLEGIARTSSNVASAVAITAAQGLAHEKADVQKAAFAILSEYGDTKIRQLRSEVEKYVPVVSAAVKKDVTAWLGDGKGTATTAPKKQLAKKTKASSTKSTSLGEKTLSADLGQHAKELVGALSLKELLHEADRDVPEIYATRFDGTDIPRLGPSRRITPIEDIEELIEVCTRVLEDPTLIDDGERALAAIARLNTERPDDFDTLAGPLLKRAKDKLKKGMCPFAGRGIDCDLKGVIYSWLTREKFEFEKADDPKGRRVLIKNQIFEPDGQWEAWNDPTQPYMFLTKHWHELSLEIADGKTRPLLSAPTHEGGWIDPRELVVRVRKLTEPPTERDAILAMLRLAPEFRAEALASMETKLKGEWLNAIRYALGAEKIRIGKTASLWIAAARSRKPFADDLKVEKAFPGMGPDCGLAVRYKFHESNDRTIVQSTEFVKDFQDNSIPTLLLQQMGYKDSLSHHDLGEGVGHVRWTATMWSIARESFFAIGAQRMGFNSDWWDASWHLRTYMEPLLDADTPLREMGMLLMFIGLTAKEPGEHGLATDVAIQAIDDGRLGTDNLAEAIQKFLHGKLFKMGRLAKTFTNIADVSPLHAYVVLRAFEKTLRGEPKNMPRAFGDILEMLFETASRQEYVFNDAAFREFLASFKGSSKPAKMSKSLLANDETGDQPLGNTAWQIAVENRLQRLEQLSARK